MNEVIISGNITRDPEVRYSSDGDAKAMARFSVACQRQFKNKDGNYDADFPNVVAWGKTAEFIGEHFHKGDRIEVVGELRTGSYTNKDGVKVYTTDVWASKVGFAGGKSSSNASVNTTAPKKSKQELDMNIPEGVDDELPFD